jgi:hypothetical protein
MMANGKFTLAELRKEAERVGAHGSWSFVLIIKRQFGVSTNEATERLIEYWRTLPDGALKEW